MTKILKAALFLLLAFSFPSSSDALTAEEFYRNAKKIENINAFAATCQSAHETGFWTSGLWKSAMNGAGIKADRKWRSSGRRSVLRRSPESVGGRIIYRESYFRAYGSIEEFLADYGIKVKRDYPLASKHSDTALGYFALLRRGRLGSWATTPKYFEYLTDKAVRLAPKLLGAEWKTELARDYKLAVSRGLLSQGEISIVKKRFAKSGISAE
ncbi:MAG: glucosaminidase domain-containing protein [Synergistaceae bacterium]|jgi:hypothetical protein|nr:glucosaminidase domain-containing protein [Synergistaceae bacterium]